MEDAKALADKGGMDMDMDMAMGIGMDRGVRSRVTEVTFYLLAWSMAEECNTT